MRCKEYHVSLNNSILIKDYIDYAEEHGLFYSFGYGATGALFLDNTNIIELRPPNKCETIYFEDFNISLNQPDANKVINYNKGFIFQNFKYFHFRLIYLKCVIIYWMNNRTVIELFL